MLGSSWAAAGEILPALVEASTNLPLCGVLSFGELLSDSWAVLQLAVATCDRYM